MNLKYKIAIYLCLVLMPFRSSLNSINDGFDRKLIKVVNGKIIETGINYDFELKKSNNSYINTLTRMVNSQAHWKYRKFSQRGSKEEIAQISSNNVQGYIKIVENGSPRAYISVSEEGKNQLISTIKNKLDSFVMDNKLKSNSYSYIKVKCGNNNIDGNMDNVEKAIIDNRGKNIEKTKIKNGFSIIAYMGEGPAKKIGDELIDINCAVCKYDTGVYLFIGSPIVSITY